MGLVLVSVIVGVKVVSSAEHTTRYWAADHDLAAGVVLQQGDLHSVAARLPPGPTGYITAGTSLGGQQVNRPIGAGELIPSAALGRADAATTITIPLGGDNAPKISSGQRITIWVSTRSCPSTTVLADVAVQAVQGARVGALGSSGGEDVIVRVDPQQAQRVVEALALDGGVLRAGIVDGAPASTNTLSDLGKCAAGSS